jgi:hypothetical protein
LGNSYRSSVHGIESPDMENSHHGWCPADINRLRIPFRFLIDVSSYSNLTQKLF